ncbi:hypothetical protein MRS76_24595 [Rhizobiaceae bacterium n13]|uniref:Uncharacterized protein n=1 Tax=Ferirhizobium litorale TaxID=2927786 RepID=A0AAE3QL07_9HYPH|nr:hypothetical protein [Fererhizobium litorale]MDI7865098.1 hypothetical protein [Fererhizobium litorale]MDI7925099.1 hypothetical protein [Fererhizobium litorale]
MSSPHPKQYLEPDDLRLLRNVLNSAGFNGSTTTNQKRVAAHTVLTAYQNGTKTKQKLIAAIRGNSLSRRHFPRKLVRSEALDRWDDDGGAIPEASQSAHINGNPSVEIDRRIAMNRSHLPGQLARACE